MKKQLSIILILALSSLSIFNSGCKKETKDTTAPVITINGLSTCYLQRGRVYYDAAATAIDETDGTLKVNSTNNVNIGVIGTYNYTYTASDNAGNTATAIRTIYVVDVEGSYTNVLNITPYPAVASIDSTHYNDTLYLSIDMRGQLNCSAFGNHFGGYVTSQLTSGTTLTVPSQTVICGNPNISRTFTGSGTISNPTTHTKIVINYTEVSDTTHHSCGVYLKD